MCDGRRPWLSRAGTRVQLDAPPPSVSLDSLYRRYAAWLRGRLVRRYGAQDAEDLDQETWARLAPYHARHEVRHPKALLLRIAGNLAADQRGRRARRRALADAAAWTSSQVQAPGQDEAVLLREIVLGLPEGLRDVFLMSRVAGLTTAQIADRLGVSPKTVEWRMTKALAHCAAQLRRQG